MADRRSIFSRFWTAPASRRTPTPNSPSRDKSQPISQSSPNSAASASPTPTTQPTTNRPTNDQPNSKSPEPRKSPSSQERATTNPTDEPKAISPSRVTTQSPSSSKPASPSRRVAQSRSPPQPSSTPKRAPQPRSNSHSPKQGSASPSKKTQPTSPSKESRKPAQGISNSHEGPILASNEKNPKPVAEVKSDSADHFKGQTLDGKSKHDEVEQTPTRSSEVGPEKRAPSKSLDSSTIKGEDKPLVEFMNTEPEEANVKEVVQATNNLASEETMKEVNDSLARNSGSEKQIIQKEANGNTKKEVNDSLSPKSGVIEKPEIPSKPDQKQGEKQQSVQTKEILATSPPNATISQSKKTSTNSGTHNKSTVPNGDHVPLHKNIRDNMATSANQMAVGDPKGAIDRHVNVITLAGDNRGASMQMESNSSKREGPVHIHRSYKVNPDESGEATTDGEGSSDQKKSGDTNPTDDQTTEAYVNNNSQGINNSIVFSSSVTEGNPGVHMLVTYLQKEQMQSTEKANFPEARKAEFNMSRTEKLTYQPTVRRRCLQGLFLETSDSDPDNPERPRRHGCRVGCQKSDKDNNVDVL